MYHEPLAVSLGSSEDTPRTEKRDRGHMTDTPESNEGNPQYILADSDMATEDGRLAMLEAMQDPGTTRRLDQLGVEDGWQCLELGAGRGSITRWLAGRVGVAGSVVAADIDPRFLDEVPENVEVRKLDIRDEDIESERYDLVHCRCLLMHLPDPGAVLTKMVGALRPGGLLLAEEPDSGLAHVAGHPDAPAVNEIRERAINISMQAGILNFNFGRTLPGMLIESGLELQGRPEVDTQVAQPGDIEYKLSRISSLEGTKRMVTAGMMAEADLELVERFYSSTGSVIVGLSLVAAAGRKADTHAG
jgi:SAM-dependent methyltransferase